LTQQPRALEVRPIGVINSPWHETLGTPIQPVFADGAVGRCRTVGAECGTIARVTSFWACGTVERLPVFFGQVLIPSRA
jgi:hypothetical protein